MKHTLNVLTLTALAAAASAQTAPASGLSYNQVTLSRTSRQNTLTVQAQLGQSNFVVGAATTDANQAGDDYNYSQISVGYVFKGLTNGIDATVGVIQGSGEYTVYTATLRRQLNEVYQGLEIAVGYAGTLSSGNESDFSIGGTTGYAESASFAEISYNVNKTFSVAAGLVKYQDSDRETVLSVRAGF